MVQPCKNGGGRPPSLLFLPPAVIKVALLQVVEVVLFFSTLYTSVGLTQIYLKLIILLLGKLKMAYIFFPATRSFPLKQNIDLM